MIHHTSAAPFWLIMLTFMKAYSLIAASLLMYIQLAL